MTTRIILSLLTIALSSSAQIPVYFNATHFAGFPLRTNIVLTPITGIQTDGTNLITGASLNIPYQTNGTVVNLWPAAYSVKIGGVNQNGTLFLPNSTNGLTLPINAAAWMSNIVTYTFTNSIGPTVGTNTSWTGSKTMLIAAVAAGEYQMLATEYNATLTPTNALVLWPDGTYGIWTATNISATWLTADGYMLTYTNTGELIAQPTVLRDQNGNVTNSPALLIYP